MIILCQLRSNKNTGDPQHWKKVLYFGRGQRFFAIILFGSTPTLSSACEDRLYRVPATVWYTESKKTGRQEDAVVTACGGWEGVEAIPIDDKKKAGASSNLFHLQDKCSPHIFVMLKGTVP